MDANLLLNVMEVFCGGGGALLHRPCMVFQRRVVPVVQCASKCSFHRLCFCMSEVISSFKSLRAGSQVFALLMLFLCAILHTMWSGKSLQLLCILPFGVLCLSAISLMFVKIMLAVCMLMGMVVAPNDTAYKRWICHSGLKLLCKLCRAFPPPAMRARFTVFLFGHADPLDGWRCCSQKQGMSRPIQVRQL